MGVGNGRERGMPPRPTIRELMEGRAAGTDDGGIPLAGYPRRPPKSPYQEEDRVAAERRGWARRIRPPHGEEQRGAQEASEEQ